MTQSDKSDHPPQEEDLLEAAEAVVETMESDSHEPSAQAAVPNGEEEASPEPELAPDPAAELRDQLLRLRADFENFRKRTRREKEEWTLRSLEHICGDLLPVLDSFELGLKNAASLDVSADVLKGFELVQGQLKNVLGKYGLTALDAEGEVFDPNHHEAVSQVPSPEVPEGQVLAMTRRGYKLGERLLRPAQVVVSQGSPEPVPAAAENLDETVSGGET